VGVAQRVDGVGVATVGLQSVVDGDSAEARQHAGVVDALVTAFVVQRVERQRGGARGVQPAQPALDASARFVEVRDRRDEQLAVNLIEEWPRPATYYAFRFLASDCAILGALRIPVPFAPQALHLS